MHELPTTDYEAIRQQTDLRALVETYTTLKRDNGPCPFCGGEDRFYLHKGAERWGCRHCTPGGGDAVDFVVRMDKVSVPDAVRKLKGLPPRDPASLQQANNRESWRTLEWQQRATSQLRNAQRRLTDQCPGGKYLLRRGIQPATWRDFGLGFEQLRDGRPRIVIPWKTMTGTITALKYRYVDPIAATDPHKRFAQLSGSESILFGVANVTADAKTLVLVEGEINCLSLAQATKHAAYNVVSAGAERNKAALPPLCRLVQQRPYERVLTWFDKEHCALQAAEAVRGAIPMRSPHDLDANDILVKYGAQALFEVVETVIRTAGR